MNQIESSGERDKDKNFLTEKDIAKISLDIDDARLSSNEDAEYFIITHANGRTFIPKRSHIPVANESGGYSNIEISKYLRQQLDEE